MRVSNLKIGFRLGGGFGLVLLLMSVLIGVAVVRLSAIGDDTSRMVQQDWVKAEAVTSIDTLTRANARRTLELFVTDDPARLSNARARIADNKKAIDDALQTLDRLVATDQGKEALEKLKQDRAQYVVSFQKVSKLLTDGKRDEALKVVNEETLPRLDALQDTIKTLSGLQKKRVTESSDRVLAAADSTVAMMVVLGLIALAAGIWFAWWLTRSITRPMHEAVRIAETVAAGDLTSRIEATTTDETGQLLRALKNMNDSLVKIVADVRSGTETIATASGEIASGNLDLSSRTEQQAGSLEETASSMEELTSTVKQNADNARQANRLALSASSVASRGGDVMAHVVNTMGSIKESSHKIADIIAVIDGIAFQTNILALNAAVEAARAGEQGRGFAVVASEVRSLAQRSAAAAKEIKELIGNSVEKVDAGGKLVDEAGGTMIEIVQSIQRVADIMSEITAATQEQTSGIEQINQAIMQMDETTQQNASLVEEAAAASESLQEQANRLAAAVSTFKLDSTPAAAAAPAPHRSRSQAKVRVVPVARVATTSTPRPQRKALPAKRVAVAGGDGGEWEEF
jgi:methyl-accepting chemotaxis protein